MLPGVRVRHVLRALLVLVDLTVEFGELGGGEDVAESGEGLADRRVGLAVGDEGTTCRPGIRFFGSVSTTQSLAWMSVSVVKRPRLPDDVSDGAAQFGGGWRWTSLPPTRSVRSWTAVVPMGKRLWIASNWITSCPLPDCITSCRVLSV
ncbi:hypothetical protein AQJ91_22485 [Streptomyces dysideae]|uniref:Uncharacterized protein n=1 Tax=Streptomyces dysideae TaxID=909626 RepID=A0A101UY12_9ACTN|nr:hypothetical protein AQJ91_22485 [Streptomyces dysideae]